MKCFVMSAGLALALGLSAITTHAAAEHAGHQAQASAAESQALKHKRMKQAHRAMTAGTRRAGAPMDWHCDKLIQKYQQEAREHRERARS